MSREGSELDGLTASPESTAEVRSRRTGVERRDRGRLIAAAIVGALIAVFAVVNLGDVKVHWIFATGQTPLIVVIALAFVLGVIVDRLLIRARRKRRR
ncbi:MAG: LapA family protein [Solirubrobacterales bacterium]|nr:LapA family protein [Solirubrobacterales bacterium]MBV9335143.1 LapA family protein [Solirubrobacterales bacterium]MBV9941091.1 LapA family protein [Solirubrobacterales bacterium]